MTIKEEITQASEKVGTPEFQFVTCAKGNVRSYDSTTALEDGSTTVDVMEIAKDFAVALMQTEQVAPYTAVLARIPPQVFIYFVASLFISAFETGRAFEQNRQDAAISELLERDNHE